MSTSHPRGSGHCRSEQGDLDNRTTGSDDDVKHPTLLRPSRDHVTNETTRTTLDTERIDGGGWKVGFDANEHPCLVEIDRLGREGLASGPIDSWRGFLQLAIKVDVRHCSCGSVDCHKDIRELGCCSYFEKFLRPSERSVDRCSCSCDVADERVTAA